MNVLPRQEHITYSLYLILCRQITGKAGAWRELERCNITLIPASWPQYTLILPSGNDVYIATKKNTHTGTPPSQASPDRLFIFRRFVSLSRAVQSFFAGAWPPKEPASYGVVPS